VSTLRDKAVVAADATLSLQKAFQKSVPAAVIDGDTNWFNNPQYRVRSHKSTLVYISVLPAAGIDGDGAQMVSVSVVVSNKSSPTASHPHLWDAALAEVTAHHSVKLKGQEASIWALELDPKKCYHIVPHNHKRGVEGTLELLSIYN
jgi:hypothetical protein